MKLILRSSLVLILIIFCRQASGQYFVSVVDDISGFGGYPCYIKLKTGEEINGASWSTIWCKYRIKTVQGNKIKIKPSEINFISFNTHIRLFSNIYMQSLTKESQDTIHKNKELAKKDTFIFENIEGYGLYQLVNPGFTRKIRVYAYGVGFTSFVRTLNEKDNGILKYLIIRKNNKPVIVDNANYRETLKEVFSDCPAMLSGFYDEQMRWDDIGRHVYIYDQLCK